MSRREAIEAALSAWRDAERRQAAGAGERDALGAEVERQRAGFQRLSADHTGHWIGVLAAERLSSMVALAGLHAAGRANSLEPAVPTRGLRFDEPAPGSIRAREVAVNYRSGGVGIIGVIVIVVVILFLVGVIKL